MLTLETRGFRDAQRRRRAAPSIAAVFNQIGRNLLRIGGRQGSIRTKVLVETRHHLAPGFRRQEAGCVSYVATAAFLLPFDIDLGR